MSGRSNKRHTSLPASQVPVRPPVTASGIEVDLHGMSVQEAMRAVQRHLDNAYRDRLHLIKVIHGHGTGALKTAVRTLLTDSSLVKRHYFASYGDGGYGVTIAELDYGKGKPYARRANHEIGPKPERWK